MSMQVSKHQSYWGHVSITLFAYRISIHICIYETLFYVLHVRDPHFLIGISLYKPQESYDSTDVVLSRASNKKKHFGI